MTIFFKYNGILRNIGRKNHIYEDRPINIEVVIRDNLHVTDQKKREKKKKKKKRREKREKGERGREGEKRDRYTYYR